jgi:hypothetical protein
MMELFGAIVMSLYSVAIVTAMVSLYKAALGKRKRNQA